VWEEALVSRNQSRPPLELASFCCYRLSWCMAARKLGSKVWPDGDEDLMIRGSRSHIMHEVRGGCE
jgi:hypothetical protein